MNEVRNDERKFIYVWTDCKKVSLHSTENVTTIITFQFNPKTYRLLSFFPNFSIGLPVLIPDLNVLLIALASIGKCGVTASFSIVYNYSAEVFPTVIRNVGVGTASMFARIGGLISPLIATLVSGINWLSSD